MPSSKKPVSIDDVSRLFDLMREKHVFVFRGLGLSIQMSQTAWDVPPAEMPRQASADPDAPLSDMPFDLAGPYMAFRNNPTHPDAEIDDKAEQGDDLPGED